MFMADVLFFVFAAIGCALATNVEVLTSFRFLMGIGIGLDFPVAFASIAEFSAPGDLRLLPQLRSGRSGHDDGHAVLSNAPPGDRRRLWPGGAADWLDDLTAALSDLGRGSGTGVLYVVAIAPAAGLITLMLIKWEPIGYDVDVLDADDDDGRRAAIVGGEPPIHPRHALIPHNATKENHADHLYRRRQHGRRGRPPAGRRRV